MSDAPVTFLHDSPLSWAHAYAERGIRMVVLHGLEDGRCTCGKDCSKNAGKHPVALAWQKKATADYEVIKSQLAKSPHFNLGLAMGHGLVCLDVDGAPGLESLEQLMAEHPDWPAGPVQRTGSGSLHFLFRTFEDFSNSVGKVGPGLDVRSKNGQIVAQPSLHRSGQRYEWLVGSWKLEIPELPEWLADLMRGSATSTFDVGKWLEKQPPAISGENGNKALMAVTASVIRQGHIRNPESFLTTMEPWNARCVPPWSDAELTHAFDNAFARFQTEALIDLPMNKNGEVVCDRTAVRRIVRQDARYEFAFELDEISKNVLYNGRPLTEVMITNIEEEICGRYCLRQLSRQWLTDSINAAAHERSFNGVKEYLKPLRWDGIERLTTVPGLILGAGSDPLFGLYFQRWCIGAVARAFEPGCKNDCALILQGDQGIRKSTFFRTLAGDEHFRDTFIDLHDKDSMLQIQTWIYEMAEMSSVSRADVERVKGFLSTQVDTFRPPYGRNVESFKRTCAIAGTTNRLEILNDPTGARRFWIIPCGAVEFDLEWVRTNRDQLWAEAVHRYRAGERWHLDNAERALQTKANEIFQTIDPLYESALEEIGRMESAGQMMQWRQLCMRLEVKSDCGPGPRNSLIRALRDAGYESIRKRQGGQLIRVWEKAPVKEASLG